MLLFIRAASSLKAAFQPVQFLIHGLLDLLSSIKHPDELHQHNKNISYLFNEVPSGGYGPVAPVRLRLQIAFVSSAISSIAISICAFSPYSMMAASMVSLPSGLMRGIPLSS